MIEILRDLTPSVLAKAIEDNMYTFTPFAHNHWPGIEKLCGPDLSWCVTDIAFPMCNVAFRAQLQPENVDGEIESFIAKGKSRNVPLYWYIGKDSQPANLGEKLMEHDFIYRGNSPGMAIDLLAMNENVLPPSNLTITEVKDVEKLKKWCHVTSVGFGMPEQTSPALFEWFTTSNRLKLPQKFYLGWLDGKPVATSMSFFANGVAGLYFVAVLPEARNQGVGYAITQAPLREARRMGYRVGTLEASKMGEPVYLRMGFKEYFRINSYLWLNEKIT